MRKFGSRVIDPSQPSIANIFKPVKKRNRVISSSSSEEEVPYVEETSEGFTSSSEKKIPVERRKDRGSSRGKKGKWKKKIRFPKKKRKQVSNESKADIATYSKNNPGQY